MATVKLYPPSEGNKSSASSPLPQLLQTPSGLALLELQGTINLPQDAEGNPLRNIEVGRIDFPDYDPDSVGTGWMKRVHMYIGQHQRLNGEVKKLPKAMAIVRRREGSEEMETQDESSTGGEQGGDLEVVEIVKYKLMFSHRPEPVGTAHAPA
jgi:chromosome transmission fidelity protein 8